MKKEGWGYISQEGDLDRFDVYYRADMGRRSMTYSGIGRAGPARIESDLELTGTITVDESVTVPVAEQRWLLHIDDGSEWNIEVFGSGARGFDGVVYGFSGKPRESESLE